MFRIPGSFAEPTPSVLTDDIFPSSESVPQLIAAGGNFATYGCSVIWMDSRTSDEAWAPYSDLHDGTDSPLPEDLMDTYSNIDG